MFIEITEANFPKTKLSELCKPFIQDVLGVYPFPAGEDSVILKAVYFNFNPTQMDIVVGEDVKILVGDDSITVFINRNCNPNGGWDKVLEEPITSDNPFAKAMKHVVDFIAKETQKHGSDWCRIGNYKTLEIPSPFIDRLKALCLQNPDIKLPGKVSSEVKSLSNTPEVEKTLSLLRDEVLPESKVDFINKSQTDGVKPNIRKIEKPLTDRQKKNRLDKLLSLGIGGEKDKPKLVNQRIRKVR